MKTIIFVTTLLVFSPVLSASDLGTTSGDYLNLNKDVRSAGMGGAYAAVADGVTGRLYTNPSGGTELSKKELGSTFSTWVEGINYNILSFGFPSKIGDFSAGIFNLDYGKMKETKVDSGGRYTLGDDFSANANIISLGYSNKFRNKFRFGINLNNITDVIKNDSKTALSYDFGMKYELFEEKLNLGLSLRNNGAQFAGYPLPATTNLGIGSNLGIFLFTFDAIVAGDSGAGFSFGTEANIKKTVALRFGYNSLLACKASGSIPSGLSFGFGIYIKKLSLEYACSPFANLSLTNTFSLKFAW